MSFFSERERVSTKESRLTITQIQFLLLSFFCSYRATKPNLPSTNLSFFYGSEGPLVGLPHHNNPAGAVVSMDGLPVPVQVCQRSGESRFPPAQRHIVRVITAHLHPVHEGDKSPRGNFELTVNLRVKAEPLRTV